MDTLHYEREFSLLKADISKMLSLVADSFEMSLSSLELIDPNLARKVLLLDDEIDAINREIEEKVYEIIARYTPISKDLRYVITMIKFSNNLERIADLSCNVAEKTIDLYNNKQSYNMPKQIKEMFGITLKMLHDTFLAFSKRDVELSKKIWFEDQKLDDIEIEIRGIVKGEKNCDILSVLIARDLERIGDHLTNLCEEIIYIEKGEEIKKILEGDKNEENSDSGG
ncbi:phosphate signaling complex protein PhoU [Thermosipho atlanticus]|uniref:Phosphate-specific transport system accessory protein PhoU n=1 Tax=Thermosipho atlanticus DSM 15807 TaxID=1123380 RepID=A0A1M5TKS9_9BACT|nr:phosphate signaling complex protein PhoU [Thermosipho atlanticus]SHH51270.1 phosphate uptake regulator, PhoU [Thermosipho atlanticus DSM 15807]